MKYQNIREEELKNKVGNDYFSEYDTTRIVGNIDFTVSLKNKNRNQQNIFDEHSLLWAEAKTGNFDIIAMFAQLILTIGKARTFDKNLPPAFLGAFDFKKIAFVPYGKVQHLFFKNDFNWNVTSSNCETKEFIEIHTLIGKILKSEKYEYEFGKEDRELAFFIKNNIAKSTESGKIQIDKNNFVSIYLRWLDIVKPIINFDFSEGKKQSILDSDFYLADLFVDDHDTTTIEDDTALKEELFVVFKNSRYEIAKENLKSLFNATIEFKEKKRHELFWKRYKRPPIKEFQDYIIERRDLLVPQDIRERKGAFFTPKQWVELSQIYLSKVLGKNWQDEYFIWDCACGTGNLLAGLTNKYNIWASTLDQADVKVMHDRIEHGANLLVNHVFQFDFLNDDFTKLPKGLQEIIHNEDKRKKLVIYINPPYAEADNRRGDGRTGVAVSEIHKKYSDLMGYTKREIYIQFLTRIYCEMPGVVLANFSTLKNLQAPKYTEFREFYQAKLEKLVLTPADTFDNVKGQFPIGFFIWNTGIKEEFKFIEADVYDKNGNFVRTKTIWNYDKVKFINDWVKTFRQTKSNSIATIIGVGSDFQNQRLVRFGEPFMKVPASNHNWQTTKENLIETSIYFTVRHIIEANWLNDRDQFLFPNDNWKTDFEFQNDCLTHTLFNNNISNSFGVNNWIPFTEDEVNAKEKFASHFMTDFINGKLKTEQSNSMLFNDIAKRGVYDNKARQFSCEAKAVFCMGRELWKYYHLHKDINVNASLYDIREYFQGRNDKGTMNSKSADEKYTKLIGDLRGKLKLLADKITPKVYEYGFLKEEII